MPQKVQEFIDQVVFAHFYELFESEQNKEVIEKTLECIRDMCEQLGPGAVINQVDKIVTFVNLLLDKKAFCQTKSKDFKGEVDEEGSDFEDNQSGEDNDSEEDDDEEDLDHDEIILGNSTDLVNALSKAFGDQFITYFSQIAPRLVKYLGDSHPKSDKIMVIGCLAETFNNCQAAIPVYFNDFMEVIYGSASKSDDSGLYRNCAYAIGILAEHGKGQFIAHIDKCIQGNKIVGLIILGLS